MQVDFGRTASDFARHRVGFPARLFDQLAELGIGLPGQRLLDIGAGTGALARRFAQRGCVVTALDPSVELTNEAQRLDAQAGLSVSYVNTRAERTGLPDRSFDVATAGQCWHWLDPRQSVPEIQRVLIRGGRLAVVQFGWIPVPGGVVEATERLIEIHNPRWKLGGGNGLHPEFERDVSAGGFRDIETFSFDIEVTYSHEAWRGRIRASAGVGASLPDEAIDAFDRDLTRLLKDRFTDDPLPTPHRLYALVARAP
ncbi:MAG: methyltransferase domain-containing protein [Planctomycetes bacterium]|nr:methyltransferase domain-containing protein [Planctomycetota bacterium]